MGSVTDLNTAEGPTRAKQALPLARPLKQVLEKRLQDELKAPDEARDRAKATIQ